MERDRYADVHAVCLKQNNRQVRVQPMFPPPRLPLSRACRILL